MPLDAPGLWIDVRDRPARRNSPALFVDRDGTLIEDKGYLADPARVELIAGILPALRQARERRLPVVVVSNQSGIARGLYGWPEFFAVMAELVARLAEQGVDIAAILACAYYASAIPELNFPDHPMRKPRGGMLQRAAALMDLDLERSLIVGDKPSDMLAGADAGLRRGFLIGAGEAADLPQDFACTGIVDAPGWSALEAAVRAAAPRPPSAAGP